MKRILLAALVLLLAAVIPSQAREKTILIKGGLVYDGSGAEPRQADILVKGEKIVAIEANIPESKADNVINAQGEIVAPGFIDPHSHINRNMKKPETKENEGYLAMGVTTVLCGMCGGSPVPISKEVETLESQGFGTNIGYFIGLGSVRKKVMGNADRKPTPAELEEMKNYVREAMREGAFGVTTGLIYTPGCFAETEEIIELTKVIAPYKGIYSTHMRNEGTGILKAMDEAFTICREAGVDLNISHLKCGGKSKGNAAGVVAKIHEAQASGLHVTADQYPYTASSTSLSATVLPKWAAAAGSKRFRRMIKNADTLNMIRKVVAKNVRGEAASNIIISPLCKNEEIKGRSIAELAEAWDVTPEDAAIECLRRSWPSAVKHSFWEEDVRYFMKQPFVMTCTDGSIGGHPRAFGTFTRKIKTYVREEKVISMGDMIRRSTGLVADTYGIGKRGYLRKGYWADIIVFDPEMVTDHATYEEPQRLSTGFTMVMVNGKIAISNDIPNHTLSGKVIKMENKAKVR
ncbi:MAG: D-aminoacylase [Bacteroidales bacterium]|nr:D-aminoacylase [Bacteroidales bacterium]